MSVVHVEASRNYDVFIDEYTLDDVGALARGVAGGSVACIVSDTNVAPLYAQRAQLSLEQAGYQVATFVFPAGEASKTLATYGECLAAFAECGMTRDSVVVALGGGVVGDLAGFAAATYMRGCQCIQVPTSLLACVDSSVGGKTAVDLPEGKNLVGAFFQPSAVLIDTALLNTLQPHFFTDGCAEIIKYGVIADAQLFDVLQKPLMPGDDRLAQVIEACVTIKRNVVQLDEHEGGVRQILNFGHTLGHAIEKHSNFAVTHGFAVAFGMVLIARACAVQGICSAQDAQRVESLVAAYGFAVDRLPDASGMYECALADKKRHGSTMNVVSMRAIGTVEVAALSLDDFKQLVKDALDGWETGAAWHRA